MRWEMSGKRQITQEKEKTHSNYRLTSNTKWKKSTSYFQINFLKLLLNKENRTFLIEEYLFFRQYNFHKQKIHFHRATMKNYEKHLTSMGYRVTYIDALDKNADIRTFLETQVNEKCTFTLLPS